MSDWCLHGLFPAWATSLSTLSKLGDKECSPSFTLDIPIQLLQGTLNTFYKGHQRVATGLAQSIPNDTSCSVRAPREQAETVAVSIDRTPTRINSAWAGRQVGEALEE